MPMLNTNISNRPHSFHRQNPNPNKKNHDFCLKIELIWGPYHMLEHELHQADNAEPAQTTPTCEKRHAEPEHRLPQDNDLGQHQRVSLLTMRPLASCCIRLSSSSSLPPWMFSLACGSARWPLERSPVARSEQSGGRGGAGVASHGHATS
jgi:hypothetical protein